MRIDVSGKTFVRAGRGAVWAALHDPDVLARCVPGCRSLRRLSDRDYALTLGLAPFGSTYAGTIRIARSDAPRLLHLAGRDDRVAETAGTAEIALEEAIGGCTIHYVVDAEIRGLPALAGRAVSLTVGRMIASTFATRFGDLVGRPVLDPAPA